jgi:hypothetical protein
MNNHDPVDTGSRQPNSMSREYTSGRSLIPQRRYGSGQYQVKRGLRKAMQFLTPNRQRQQQQAFTKVPEVPKGPFRLLDLPAELQLQVLEFALAPTKTYFRPPKDTKPPWETIEPEDIDLSTSIRMPSANPKHLKVLLTCKTIFEEGRSIAYKRNTLFFTSINSLEEFLDPSFEDMLKHTRHIEISQTGSVHYTLSPGLLNRMANVLQLRSITINHSLVCQAHRNDGRCQRNPRLLDAEAYIKVFADRVWPVLRTQWEKRGDATCFKGMIYITWQDNSCPLDGGRYMKEHCSAVKGKIIKRFAENRELEKKAKMSELSNDGGEVVSSD